jgi:hypothetical protein
VSEHAWDDLVDRFLAEPDVDVRTAFASPALRVGGKIFAMLIRGELVLKLPAQRCAALVADGRATAFEAGGRTMREWVALGGVEPAEWQDLAEEAQDFVRP